MLYEVYMDGNNIYYDSNGDIQLSKAELEIELGAAGEFTFELPPTNPYYNYPTVMLSSVEIYECNQAIWYGRVVRVTIKLNGNKSVYCEGALAFCNDTMQPYKVWENVTLNEIFNDIIDEHNSQMTTSGQDNRKFTVSGVNNHFTSITVTKWDTNYESTSSALKKLVSSYGGAFHCYRGNRSPSTTVVPTEIAWVYLDGSWSNPQSVQYGVNITDLSAGLRFDNCWTVLLPLGKKTTKNNVTTYVNVSEITGSEYITTNLLSTYGWVVERKQWSNANNAQQLYDTAMNYIASQQFEQYEIDVDAIDLMHFPDTTATTFIMVGQAVWVYSAMHAINYTALAKKITYNLINYSKKVKIGLMDYPEVSVEVAEAKDSVEVSTAATEEAAIEKTSQNDEWLNTWHKRRKNTGGKLCFVIKEEEQ